MGTKIWTLAWTIYFFHYFEIIWLEICFGELCKYVCRYCTCKSCISVRSLVLSADRKWLSGLDADSLLSKQETMFERSFSYLKHINRNTGTLKCVCVMCWHYYQHFLLYISVQDKPVIQLNCKCMYCSVALTFAKEKAGFPVCSVCPLPPVHFGHSLCLALSQSFLLALCH